MKTGVAFIIFVLFLDLENKRKQQILRRSLFQEFNSFFMFLSNLEHSNSCLGLISVRGIKSKTINKNQYQNIRDQLFQTSLS